MYGVSDERCTGFTTGTTPTFSTLVVCRLFVSGMLGLLVLFHVPLFLSLVAITVPGLCSFLRVTKIRTDSVQSVDPTCHA